MAKINSLNIRYTPLRNRIKSLIPEHYKGLCASAKAFRVGDSIFNSEALRLHMGVPAKRFNAIVEGKTEPTLGEIVAYADYCEINPTELYEKLPHKVKTVRKAIAA